MSCYVTARRDSVMMWDVCIVDHTRISSVVINARSTRIANAFIISERRASVSSILHSIILDWNISRSIRKRVDVIVVRSASWRSDNFTLAITTAVILTFVRRSVQNEDDGQSTLKRVRTRSRNTCIYVDEGISTNVDPDEWEPKRVARGADTDIISERYVIVKRTSDHHE